MAALTQQPHGPAQLVIWQSETAALAWHYAPEASIALATAATAVAWLPGLGTSLAVAVACSDNLIIFCRAHGGTWAQIAKLGTLAQPLSALRISHTGMPIISAGTQLGVVSNLVPPGVDHPSLQGLAQVSLGHLALEAGGPLPDYAPAALALQILRGRMHAAGEVIRCVLAWLKLHAAHQDPSIITQTSSSNHPLAQQLLPDASLSILLDRPFLHAFSAIVKSLPSKTEANKQNPSRPSAADGQTGEARQSQPQASSPAPADPFAFDAAAFSADDSSQAAEPSRHQTGSDPHAFDAGAFGGSDSPPEFPRAASAAVAPKDPFAFDMGAFGMMQEEDEQPEEQDSDHQPAQGQPGQAADPFAFDAGAFGLEDDQAQQASEPAQTDPYAFDAGRP